MLIRPGAGGEALLACGARARIVVEPACSPDFSAIVSTAAGGSLLAMPRSDSCLARDIVPQPHDCRRAAIRALRGIGEPREWRVSERVARASDSRSERALSAKLPHDKNHLPDALRFWQSVN